MSVGSKSDISAAGLRVKLRHRYCRITKGVAFIINKWERRSRLRSYGEILHSQIIHKQEIQINSQNGKHIIFTIAKGVSWIGCGVL